MTEAQFAPEVPAHRLLDKNLGGDGLEKPLWSHLADKFPRYELFWSEFIWPLSNRVYPERPGRKLLHLRSEVMERYPNLIWLAQAHYIAFRRYGSLYFRVHGWPFSKSEAEDPNALLKALLHQDRFSDIYTLFIGVDDMISTMASMLVRLRADTGIAPLPADPSEAEVRDAFEKWLNSKNFKKAVERNRLTGFSIAFQFSHRGSDLKTLLPESVMSKYNAFRARVAGYRNLLHSPHPAQMWKEGEHLVPKPDKVSNYRLWPIMASAEDSALETDFTDVEKALAKDVDDLSTLLDQVWKAFIANMREVAATEKYAQWLELLPEPEDFAVTSNGLTHYYAPATSSAAELPLSLSAQYVKDKKLGGFGI